MLLFCFYKDKQNFKPNSYLYRTVEKVKNILLVAATQNEVAPLVNLLQQKDESGKFCLGNLEIQMLITGVGMVPTAYQLGKYFSKNKPQLAINIGIAGSFKDQYPVGTVVQVLNDSFSELGAEQGDGLLTLSQMGLDGVQHITNETNLLNNHLSSLPAVNAITVNTVHGTKLTINRVMHQFDPDIETMEGAAFFFACEAAGVPYIQLRAVSNKVEPRNKELWNIPLAINNLTELVFALLRTFGQSMDIK